MKDPIAPTVTIYWGSVPEKGDTPSVVKFSTDAEMRAYFEGVNAADGWMEVEFVDGPNYRADKDSEIVQTKARRGDVGPGDVFAMWGDPPEPGTTPEVYRFETEAEAEAFAQGATDMVGWLGYHVVPDASFHPYQDVEDAFSKLEPEAARALKNHLDLNDDASVGYGDVVFVRDDGAVVGTDWSVGDRIENQPLTRQEWVEMFSQAFEQSYGVGLEDLEIDDTQVDALFASEMARMPEQAVENIANARQLPVRKAKTEAAP